MGSYVRRWEDWRNQADQAAERIKELNRQLISAEIRIQTAEKDLEVFDQQVENSKEIYDYMRSKFSNEQLYGWMIGQLKTFHRGAYKLAAGMARQAQMAYKRELGDGINIPSDMLTSDHWDSGRAGLLAGEKLSFELKKLDDAYLRARANLTIYELSRTVSLRRLDPVQLFNLRAGGPVSIVLPEWLFQTDHNGRTLKDMRLKAVSISLPCTVGPNTRVPLQVRLVSTNPVSPAQRTIITSTAQGDSGRFDPNPNGETYLPFENENVSSTWEITLPKHLEFDPGTISDLIFNIRYTAQPAGIEEDEVQTTTLAQNQGRFGVSLRQDNYDGWLKLQRDLDTTIGHTCSEYFPNAVVTAATPYVYGSVVGAKSYYVVLADGSAEELSSQTVPDPETNSTIFPVGAVSGKREYNFKEIVDIVQVNSVTVP